MLVQSFPKPKIHKHHARNNPKPTIDDICRFCGRNFASTHEIYEGTGRRQLSIKYHMQVKVCNECHVDIQLHPLAGRDLALKQEFQAKFEQEHGHEFYMKCFMINYL